MKTVLLLIALLPALSQATEMPSLDAYCAAGVNAVPGKPGWWHMDYPRLARTPEALFGTTQTSVVKIEPSGDTKNVAYFVDPVRDLAFYDGELWALFRDRIMAFDPESGAVSLELPTTLEGIPGEDYSAKAFAWVGNKLVIAHGAYGTVTFDPATRSMSAMDPLGLAANGQLSKAIDVTAMNDHQAVFAVEAVTLSENPPFTFNGLIVRDLESGGNERFAYDRAKSGVLSNTRIAVDGDLVILNNWGALQRASLAGMRKSGSVEITWTPVQFDVNGTSQPGELLGDLILEQGRVVSCAETSYQDPVSHKVVHKGLVFSGTY